MFLSIDFDFFVRELDEWDWGHQESPLYRDYLWAMREMGNPVNLREEMDPNRHSNPKPADLWHTLTDMGMDLRGAKIAVGDSHVFGYPFFKSLPRKKCTEQRIVHLDAHADLGYAKDLKSLMKWIRYGKIECGSWLFALMWEYRTFHLDVVYPVWKGLAELESPPAWKSSAVSKRVQCQVFGTDASIFQGKVEGVYLCRSGSWTPPWLDSTFIEVARGLEEYSRSTLAVPFVDQEECNPMVPRKYQVPKVPNFPSERTSP